MNPIEELLQYLKATYPQAGLVFTPPMIGLGETWFIDFGYAGKNWAIEWSEAIGFGLSKVTNESYGERPDESYKTVGEIERRITDLVRGI